MIALILQVSGLVGVSLGVTMLSVPMGVITAGASLILLGLALERGR
jgi:hypothetical protein